MFFGQKWEKMGFVTFDPIFPTNLYQIGSILYISLNEVSATQVHQFNAIFSFKSRKYELSYSPTPYILDLK